LPFDTTLLIDVLSLSIHQQKETPHFQERTIADPMHLSFKDINMGIDVIAGAEEGGLILEQGIHVFI